MPDTENNRKQPATRRLSQKSQARNKRLEMQLRANLRRRKEASRARGHDGDDTRDSLAASTGADERDRS